METHPHPHPVRSANGAALDGRPVVVNPGTLFREDQPGCCVLDTEERRVETYRLGERLTVVPVSRAVP